MSLPSQSNRDLFLCVLFSSHSQKSMSLVLCPSLTMINPYDIFLTWIMKKENWPTKMKMQPKEGNNAESEI